MGKDSAQERARRSLEGFRAKMILRFGERRCKLFFILTVILAALLILFIAALLLIRIETIEVTGDLTVFNEGEVIEAAEVDIGDGLFWKNSFWIRKNIEKNMPLAQKVKVKKSLFGKLTISIELSAVDYCAKIGDMYYALDEELTVLDKNETSSKYTSYGAVLIKLPEVREPVLGKKLIFFDTVEETNEEKETLYPVRAESFYAYTLNFLHTLKESGYHADADAVILTEKFEIRLIYAGKYSVNFGDPTDFDIKFRVLYEILAEGSTQYADKVSVDLSDPSRATARTDLTLDFSEFAE